MESGKIDFPDDLFFATLPSFGINDFTLENNHDQLSYDLRLLITYLYKFDYEKFTTLITQLVRQKQTLINSDAFFLWHLIYLLFFSEKDREKALDEFEPTRKIVEFGLSTFDRNTQCLYYWIVANYYNAVDKFDLSNQFLDLGFMHLNVADWEILESLMIMLKIQNSVKTNDSEYAFTNLWNSGKRDSKSGKAGRSPGLKRDTVSK